MELLGIKAHKKEHGPVNSDWITRDEITVEMTPGEHIENGAATALGAATIVLAIALAGEALTTVLIIRIATILVASAVAGGTTAAGAELAPMNEVRDQENSAEHMLSPIILDLDGNGVTTTTVAEGAFFDHDLDGKHELTAWVGGNDGMLVYDKNNDGIINNGNEVFGDHYLTYIKEAA